MRIYLDRAQFTLRPQYIPQVKELAGLECELGRAECAPMHAFSPQPQPLPPRDVRQALIHLAARVDVQVEALAMSKGLASGEMVRMFLSGSVAVASHLRPGQDIAALSRMILPYEDMLVTYRRPDGLPWHMFLEGAFSPAEVLLDFECTSRAEPWAPAGDPASGALCPFVMAPVDIAVARTLRASAKDVQDVLALAASGLVTMHEYRRCATAALLYFPGNVQRARERVDQMAMAIEHNLPSAISGLA